jgi:hypothetical protein
VTELATVWFWEKFTFDVLGAGVANGYARIWPKLWGWVTVRLNTTAETLAGIPLVAVTWKLRTEFAPAGELLRVSTNRDGFVATKAPTAVGVPPM